MNTWERRMEWPLTVAAVVFLGAYAWPILDGGGQLPGRVALYVSVGSSLIAFVAALAVLDAERDAEGASITTFGDAIWWACTTMTTVGYGDRYPVTTAGRFVGVGLMIGGIALLGTVTATFASWLIEAVRDEAEETETQRDAVQADLAALRERLDRVLEEHGEQSA